MQSVAILRLLWRRRVFVGLVAIVAVAVGWITAYKPTFPLERRSYTVGVATASVLVDTPRSQVVEVAPEGADALASRANVLANLMADGEIKERIVRHAGLSPKQVIASSKSPDNPAAPPTLTAESRAYETSVAMTSDMEQLPIIRVETQAPDVAGAIKLANAAVKGLTEYLNSKAATEGVDTDRRLRVRPIGPAQGHASTRGPGTVMAAAAAITMFLFGCALILALSALVRGWRTAAALENDLDHLTHSHRSDAENLDDERDRARAIAL